MSSNLPQIKKSFDRLKAITKNLSELEKNYLQASSKFKRLSPRSKSRYLDIYRYYTSGDVTELDTAEKFDVSISTVRNVLSLIGSQLVIFAKDKNIIVPKLDEIRKRKKALQKDIDKLEFDLDEVEIKGQKKKILMRSAGATAKIRIRYLAEWRKLEELELKLRSLLDAEPVVQIDKGAKQINFVTNFDKPEPNVHHAHEEKVIDAQLVDGW